MSAHDALSAPAAGSVVLKIVQQSAPVSLQDSRGKDAAALRALFRVIFAAFTRR
ncbi:MAG TPA: hypothetical protein VFJ58_04910 [Armatimonadota bacterium]|nr:hypothetical protein [Armatimonadota bacterium]